MTVFRLLIRLLKDIPAWDTPSKFALALAFVLLMLSAAVAMLVPEQRQNTLIGIAGLVIVTQFIILWGNRGMITPYTKAQRHFIDGDFDSARQLLENLHAAGKVDMRSMTLLGNTYRQLGNVEQSEVLLRGALDKDSSHYFPLYGFGRTLLAKGQYQKAAETFEKAIEAGAPVAEFDLAETYYRLGRFDEALALLQAVKPTLEESYRALMAEYLLYRIGNNKPPTPEVLRAGLPYWEAAAERFSDTLYGAALADDIRMMQES